MPTSSLKDDAEQAVREAQDAHARAAQAYAKVRTVQGLQQYRRALEALVKAREALRRAS